MEEGNFSLLVPDKAYARLKQVRLTNYVFVLVDQVVLNLKRTHGGKHPLPPLVGRVAKKTHPIIILEKKVK